MNFHSNTTENAPIAPAGAEELSSLDREEAGKAGFPEKTKRNKPLCMFVALTLTTLVVAGIIIGTVTAKYTNLAGSSSTDSDGDSDGPANETHRRRCSSSKDIPASVKGTWMDVTGWLDLVDFNCTYTEQTVGGLPVVGLNASWKDSKRANPNVPTLDQPWGSYTSRPFRGVNLGGWLSLEPFITPSLFSSDPSIVDEYSLCRKLGPKGAAETLEKHYSTFITEADFKSVAEAGLDHVRIPFSYWAVKTYDDDPYVFGISWRYLLRGIEWARKHGLRVKLDLHAVPGSQNGWNHSGKLGKVNWISGPNGTVNGQRSLDIHNSLSKFFAQDRYKNIVVFYGLVNEPAATIPLDDFISWTQQAYSIVRDNGVTAIQVFSESFRGLPFWTGKLTGYGSGLAVDAHQYTIFNDGQIGLRHADRVNFACRTWKTDLMASMNMTPGFGPTMAGEWSQADTDCAKYVNNVGVGARWNGSFDGQSQPRCPTQDSQCSCEKASADASTFSSDYKLFLRTWAEAQMSAFEASLGWFYWTWKTEDAPLWSYQAGLQGGFMPPLANQRDWDCSKPVPSFGSLPEYY